MPRSKKLLMQHVAFLASNPDSDEESANVEQLNIQKVCCRMAIRLAG